MSDLQTYMLFLMQASNEITRINDAVVEQTSQGDFWVTSSVWKKALEDYHTLQHLINSIEPLVKIETECQLLVSAYNDLVSSIEMMINSVDLDKQTVDWLAFNTGQGKMLLAHERTHNALVKLIQKVRELL